jgi:hypothetical protein
LLWTAQIDTCQCCQEKWPGLAFIEFPGTFEVVEFLAVAQRDYKVQLETFRSCSPRLRYRTWSRHGSTELQTRRWRIHSQTTTNRTPTWPR